MHHPTLYFLGEQIEDYVDYLKPIDPRKSNPLESKRLIVELTDYITFQELEQRS